jgi:long-chain acyl-CoA synthetase
MLPLQRADYARILISLLHQELSGLRPGQPLPHISEWSEATRLDSPELSVNSLERLHLASAVSEVFHVYETVFDDLLLRYPELSRWTDVVLKARSDFDSRLSFRSSGSKGVPKLCMHDVASLGQEVREWASMLGDRRRVLAYVPPHHIYGFLFGVALPRLLDIPVVDLRAGEPVLWESGDLVVSFPDHLSTIARRGRKLPSDVTVVSSSAPLDAALHATLREQGASCVLEVYGCSESGAIAYRYQPNDPYELLPYYVAQNPDSTGQRDLLRRNAQGQMRYSETPDLLRWTGARNFHVKARKDNAVQVGGMNVYPDRISQRILGHPMIREAAVRPSRLGGSTSLKALLVFADYRLDTPDNRRDVAAWLRKTLRPEELPAFLDFSSELPRNELGKATDWTERLAEEDMVNKDIAGAVGVK